MKIHLLILASLALVSCNVTRSSSIVVGIQRPAISPELVRIYTVPPPGAEQVAILRASSQNAFASDQSLTDSAIGRMKAEAARLGANGILLQSAGQQQLGSVGIVNSTSTTYGQGYGAAYARPMYGGGVYGEAIGYGASTTYGSGTVQNIPIMAQVTSGIAIYVKP